MAVNEGTCKCTTIGPFLFLSDKLPPGTSNDGRTVHGQLCAFFNCVLLPIGTKTLATISFSMNHVRDNGWFGKRIGQTPLFFFNNLLGWRASGRGERGL